MPPAGAEALMFMLLVIAICPLVRLMVFRASAVSKIIYGEKFAALALATAARKEPGPLYASVETRSVMSGA